MNVRTATAAMLVGTMLAPAARAAEPADEAVLRRDAALFDAFRRSREALEWTDEAIRHDWRLQRRPGTESCRVLDPTDGVVRAGTAAECRAALAAIEAEGRLPPPRGETVILLHGLGEGRDSMQPLAEQLRRSLDATVLTFGYASVRADIDAHGRALAAVVAGRPATRRISFVGHSLGNLVVRRWLAIAPAADRGRVHRVVMLGPPNQGSDLARMASRIWGVAESAEGAARDLVVEWQRVAPGLAVPDCPVGILAGGKGDDAGFSSLLDGDDDAVVRVAETHLPGADDFLLLPVHHAAMMRDPAVQRATREFLAQGRFPDPQVPAAAASE
ncbi:MAG: esterase/lipase family protein [Planctomycetia bacterium]